MRPDSTVLEVARVSKSFGSNRAVDDVSFAVQRGRICGLLGRNGAGKTTTLRMINGIFLPDRGSLTLFGSSRHRDARDRIGYLPEERGLFRKMGVLEQLLFFAEIKRRPASQALSSARRWLERLELWPLRDSKLEELSKGNQQKVQLIAALIHEPELLILDEPMSGFDPVNIVLVRRILQELAAAGGAILLSTHQMAEAEKLVDEIVLIHAGRVVLAGEIESVRSSFGQNTLHVAFSGDGAEVKAAPGVVRATVHGHAAELRLAPGADPQDTLAFLLTRLRLTRFEIAAPSLEEIFIDQVGADTLASEVAS